MRWRVLVLGTAILLSSPVAETGWGKSDFDASLDIGSRRELFVDYHLIGQLRGTRLKLHVPRPGGVAISYEKPWEDWYSFYTTILKDGDTYRMYYRCGMGGESYTCYAESRDGIRWTRPSLGLVEFQGSRENNLILDTGRQFCPFIDGRPGVPAAERLKANMEAKGGLLGYVSADGIHWKLARDEAIVPRKLRNHFDSQNVMFWSEAEGRYVLYCRHAVGGRRAVARSTSRDFLNWTDPVLMTYSDTGATVPSQHLYTNQTHPYFRAPHIYVALPGRFQAGRRVLNEAQTAALGTDPGFPRDPDWRVRDIADGVLLTSRAGTTIYDFTFRESLVRPGIGLTNWTSRTNYPALGVVPTGPAEMSFYVQRDYAQKTARLERMVLRTDGFSSVRAPYEGGEIVTRTLRFSGSELVINYATSAAGSLRVEIQNSGGNPIAGFAASDAVQIIGDQIERVVTWKGGSDLSRIAGKPVRLRFVMKDADLYSLQFR